MTPVEREMRGSGNGLARSDPDEMDDAECVLPARERFAACGSGVGGDFQRKRPAETVRSPARRRIGQARGVMVDGSNAEGGVRKGVGERAIGPGHG